MESLFQKMRSLAAASYPLLRELATSPLPGDRLAAVSILQVFADEGSLTFLVDLVGSEKPFVGYHATRALRFAVGALDSTGYAHLMAELQRAQALLATAEVGFDSDRQTELRAAVKELQASMGSASVPPLG
jgi:HEAT repeat protein